MINQNIHCPSLVASDFKIKKSLCSIKSSTYYSFQKQTMDLLRGLPYLSSSLHNSPNRTLGHYPITTFSARITIHMKSKKLEMRESDQRSAPLYS